MSSRSAWGFTRSVIDREWTGEAACRNSDPRLFDVFGKVLTAANEVTLRLCDGCPVRTDCRDDYLGAGRVPLGLIAGGWWWDYDGRPHPHPNDVKTRPATRPKVTRQPKRRPASVINLHVLAARNAITAARAVQIDPGLSRKAAARDHATTFRAVSDALVVARYCPDLVEEVWDGRRTLSSAFSEANSCRHGSCQEVPA